jgi:hypothetical protein
VAAGGRRWNLDILHADGVRAYQPGATPWEDRCIIPSRPARAGAPASGKSDLRPSRAQEPSRAGFPRVLPWAWSLDISDGRIWAKWAGFYQAAAAPTIVW